MAFFFVMDKNMNTVLACNVVSSIVGISASDAMKMLQSVFGDSLFSRRIAHEKDWALG